MAAAGGLARVGEVVQACLLGARFRTQSPQRQAAVQRGLLGR